MKKKILVLAAVIVVLGFLGNMVVSNASVDQPIKKEWIIEDRDIHTLAFLGISQEASVIIKKTNQTATKVTVVGSVSKKMADNLPDTHVDKQQLRVVLGSTSTVGLSLIPTETEKLTITILLGKNTRVAEYHLDGNSSIHVSVPDDYLGTVDLETNHEGKIFNKPTTKKTKTPLLKVDVVGDIHFMK